MRKDYAADMREREQQERDCPRLFALLGDVTEAAEGASSVRRALLLNLSFALVARVQRCQELTETEYQELREHFFPEVRRGR
jgi:hypothetical protein